MKRARTGMALGLILLATLFVPLASAVQGLSSQPQTTELESLIQVATSSRSYAIAIVSTAQGQGLNTTTWQALLVSGNNSLSLAQSDLSSNSNLSAGIQLAKEAMDDFTYIATNASLALRSSDYLKISEDLDSVVTANSTAVALSDILNSTCQQTPSNSSYVSQFQQDCATGRSFIGLAASDLRQASSLLIAAEAGQSTANLSQSESLISCAKGNISEAANVVSQLSMFTYPLRVRQYLSGPFVQLMNVANSTVTVQANLTASFAGYLSTFQSFSGQQSNAIESLEEQASLASNVALNTSNALSSVNSSVRSEQATLSQASTDLASFSAQIPSVLPANLNSELQSDISNVQSDITSANSAMNGLQANVGIFDQTALASTASYSSEFQANSSSLESDNQALLSSYATLQSDLNAIADLYPSPTLTQWEATLSSLGQSLDASTTTTKSSLQTGSTDLSSLQTTLNTYTSTIQSLAIQARVNVVLVANVSATLSQEEKYLNASSLAQLQFAYESVQTTAQMSISFIAFSQALLQSNTSNVASSVLLLSSRGNLLKSQSSSTLTAMTSASSFLLSDLRIRMNALTQASLDASSALRLFNDLKTPQGASLLAQASAELQTASQVY